MLARQSWGEGHSKQSGHHAPIPQEEKKLDTFIKPESQLDWSIGTKG